MAQPPGHDPDEPEPDEEPDPDDVGELLDPYHGRASIFDGKRMMLDPGQVLFNIEHAMERLDIDITTPISIEEDVAKPTELAVMVCDLRQGATLAIHVVNTAMAIMSARYPADLVTRPLLEGYDLRKFVRLDLSDDVHDIAKAIFNRRAASAVDLEPDDVAADVESLDLGGQMELFVALFYMYGTKIGALKYQTGIG